MKTASIKFILISLLLFSGSAFSEDRQNENTQTRHGSYLCSAEFSSGYEFKNGRWVRDRFIPDDKFKIEKTGNGDWSVYEFETEFEHQDCGPIEDGIIKCNVEGEFTLDFETMKFSLTSTASYVHSTRRNRDPVVLTLGTCVKL